MGSLFSATNERARRLSASATRVLTTGMLGSRGVRSRSVPTRPLAAPPESPPAPAMAPRAPPLRRAGEWKGALAGVVIGWVVAAALSGGFGLDDRVRLLHHLLLGGAIFVFVMALRRRRSAPAEPARLAPARPSPQAEAPAGATPAGDASLDEGLRDIRRLDPKFAPARFTGYIETVFGSVHTARMSRDIASLRDRVTPELYAELLGQCDRSRSVGHASHVEQIEVRAQVTEAWHEDGRDYVTAYIAGTMLNYTFDARTDALVGGSRTILEDVEAFWTFTRPAGLNPWMLSAIQAA